MFIRIKETGTSAYELAYFREYRSSGARYWKGIRISGRRKCNALPVE